MARLQLTVGCIFVCLNERTVGTLVLAMPVVRYQHKATKWTFDFSSQLLFPHIDDVIYSLVLDNGESTCSTCMYNAYDSDTTWQIFPRSLALSSNTSTTTQTNWFEVVDIGLCLFTICRRTPRHPCCSRAKWHVGDRGNIASCQWNRDHVRVPVRRMSIRTDTT